MGRARDLARLVVNSSGAIAAANIADGTITEEKIAANAVTSTKLASGAAVANLGYTPANKAGDTFTGGVNVSGPVVATGNVTAYGTV